MTDAATPDREQAHGNDASGFSLIELIVAMSIFTIFIAVFLAAVVGLARGATQAQVRAEATTGVLQVFQNIDRQVRYADAINYPGLGLASGYRYIEFRTPASSSVTNKTTCTQWRYLPDLNRIESRQWEDSSGSVATNWNTKLTTVIDRPEVTYPFELIPAAGNARQELKLTIEAGNSSVAASSEIETTFVARNSKGSPTSIVGAGGQSVSPVCQRAALRP